MSRRAKQAGVIAGAAAAFVGCAAAVSTGSVTNPVESVWAFLASTEYDLVGPLQGEYLQAVPNTFQMSGFYGTTAALPGEAGGIQGTQTFDLDDSAGKQNGSFDAIVMHNATASNPNLEILVTQDTGGIPGTAAGDVPAIGSVFNFAGEPTDINNTYMDLANPTFADAIKGTGNVFVDQGTLNWNSFPLDLVIPPYDATSHIDDHTDSLGPLPLPNGDFVEADPSEPEVYSGISANSPTATDVQGTGQTFDVLDPQGNVIGTFQGQVVDTADMFTGHSEEIWVAGDQTMTDGDPLVLGSKAGDLPTTNSVFNILYYLNPKLTSMYSDYAPATPGGTDQVSEDWNIFGLPLDTTPKYDALTGFFNGPDTVNLFKTIPLGNGLTIDPVGTPDYTEINGLPNGITAGGDNTLQGTQSFDITDGTKQLGAFTADITTYTDSTGKQDESMWITALDGASGHPTSSLDLPTSDGLPSDINLADGTVIEYTNGGWSSTLSVDPTAFGSDPDAGIVAQMLSIPLLGGEWTDVPASSDGWLGLLGITF